MRICLLGEYSGNLDEGARKTSAYLARELSKTHEVLTLDLRRVFHREFWENLKQFNPQIVHYIHGGSLKSFILLKLISHQIPSAKTIISIMRFHYIPRPLFSIIKPDFILAQSSEVEQKFKNLGARVKFFPIGGVDINRFVPVSELTKKMLRRKYGLDENAFIILHVGSVKHGRNVQLLEKLQRLEERNQVLILGSTSTGVHEDIYSQLESAGCKVWIKYFEHVEEIYALSDCYVFPVVGRIDALGRRSGDSIDIPLSVLEAMSCNLPVITTKFGALPDIFKEGNGLFFVKKEEDFINALRNIKNGIKIETRKKVIPYSWEKIAKKLEKFYYYLLEEE